MIRIDESLLRRIRSHAERTYPNECCGALLGASENGSSEIADIWPLANRRRGTAARRRFLVTGEDFRRLERRAFERRLDVVGFYHSHPDHPAVPSEYDREQALPWYAYLIVSVRRGRSEELASWRLSPDRSRFSEEPIAAGFGFDPEAGRGASDAR